MSESSPTVSIITSYYNDASFLADAISSVLTQTFTDFEYILINHASTDKSRQIAHSFKDSRIIHIDMPLNYGASGNILVKAGLDIARGEYIKLLCADDMLLPTGIEKLFLTAQKTQADLVFGDVYFINKDKQKLHKTWFKNHYPISSGTQEVLQNFINGISSLPFAGNFIKTSTLKKVKMDYVSVQMADMELWLSILMNGGLLSFVQESVSLYRIHPNQMCSITKLDTIQRRTIFEQLLYCQCFFTAIPPLDLLKNLFPHDPIISKLTKQDSLFFPFAIAHGIYSSTENHTYKLAAYLKMAEELNNDKIYPLLLKKFNYSIKDLRELILTDSVAIIDYNSRSLKGASLKELSYYFFRKIAFILLLKDWKEKRKKERFLKSGNGIV